MTGHKHTWNKIENENALKYYEMKKEREKKQESTKQNKEKNRINKMKIKYISDKSPLFWFGAGAVTIYPYIFIKKSLLNSGNVDAIVIHETIHIMQQKNYGRTWFFKYAFDKEFRLGEELAAYKAQYYYLEKTTDNEKLRESIARSLSSNTYFKMISYEDAIKIVSQW